MFESVRTSDPVARAKNAGLLPLTAFVVAQVYFATYALLDRVPAVLFWAVDLIVLAGALGGGVAIARVVRTETVRGRALAWLLGSLAIEVLCALLFVSLTFPWL